MLWERLSGDDADPSLADTAAALARDPRRLVAVVADATPSAAARSLAAAFPIAFARDRLSGAGDSLAELESVLSAAGEGPAAVVLDGFDDADALSLLPALLAHGIRPGLRVVVPCDPDRAARLAFVAGGYPRTSIAVVAAAESAREIPDIDVEVLPLVLAGRIPSGRLDGAESFVQRGLAAHHEASGDLVCLLGQEARAALVRRAFAESSGAVVDAIRRALVLAPAERARLVRGVAAAGIVPDDALADELCRFDATALPAPLEWIRRGTPLPGWALCAIDRRAQALAAGFATRVWIAKLEQRSPEEVLAIVESGLATSPDAAVAAQLELLRAEVTGTAEDAGEAVRLARAAQGAFARASDGAAARASGDAAASNEPAAFARHEDSAVRSALAHRAALRESAGELEEALADQLEIEASAVAADALQAAAAAALAQARIGEAMQSSRDAAACAERAAARHTATGDPARAAFARMRAAGLYAAARDSSAAHAAASAACSLGERTGDTRLVGYARWFLGALAERGADPSTAVQEYARSLDAYARLGEVPDRLLPSLERARAAAAGRESQLAGDMEAQVPIPVDADLVAPFASSP